MNRIDRRFWPVKREAGADFRATAIAMAYVGAALVLGLVVPRLRHGLFGWWINPEVQTEQVTTFLSSVSAGMMAFTGIIFSLLFVMLQFSSSAYSPHLLPMLSRNRTLVHAGGVFTGTFLYSLMALRGVGIAPGGGTPGLVLFVAFAWLIASVFLLLRLVRVFSGLAITDVLEMVSDLGWSHLDRMYPPYSRDGNGASDREGRSESVPVAGGRTLRYEGKPRYVVGLDMPRLLALAVESDAFVRVPIAIGDAVTGGLPLAIVYASGRVSEEHVRDAIALDRDRTLEQGPKQAIRLLVDIAIRSLSPAINDPTTAVHALDQIEGMLVRIGTSDLDIGTIRDATGTPRVWFKAATWEDYLDLALTEIRHYGAGAVQLERRLAALLAHVREQVPEERREAIDRVAAEQKAMLNEAISDADLRAKAEHIDRQGLGGGTYRDVH